MTTSVVIKANHGWPVDVRPLSRGGAPVGPVRQVAAGATEEFIVHSGQDLFIREVQPTTDGVLTQSLGEYRVGVTFNPGGNAVVDQIKMQAAALIDLIGALAADGPEVARLKALALTAVEDAAMWGVKAATKPVRA